MLKVKALSNAPGLDTLLGNKVKMIKLVLHCVIEQSCFANYTWLGRGPNGQKKESMSKLPNVLRLLHTVVKGSDTSYDNNSFLVHLKQKVIKYAYE